jgi:hypothetical protein
MRAQLIDLDGSCRAQCETIKRCHSGIHDFRQWGPRIRLSCSLRTFHRFEASLETLIGHEQTDSPTFTLCGSGDFHHVSLALVRRIRTPFNLLIIDKHPDWMRGIPALHCGTWLYHAALLPHLRRVFHVGGDLDFDNSYRFLAPWRELIERRIRVIPAVRHFTKGKWSRIAHEPLRYHPDAIATADRVRHLLEEDREDLTRWPLYISVDKDVLTAAEAVVNWDSGRLTVPEIEAVLQVFLEFNAGKVIGMDVIGDWSPVRVRGLYRRFLHWSEHPVIAVDPTEATAINERLNLRLIDFMERQMGTEPRRVSREANAARSSGRVA